IETDRKAGKRTLAVRFGPRFALYQFGVAQVLAVLVVVALGALGELRYSVSLAIAAVVAINGFRQWRRLRAATTGPELIKLLGDTGRHLAIYAGAVAAGLLV